MARRLIRDEVVVAAIQSPSVKVDVKSRLRGRQELALRCAVQAGIIYAHPSVALDLENHVVSNWAYNYQHDLWTLRLISLLLDGRLAELGLNELGLTVLTIPHSTTDEDLQLLQDELYEFSYDFGQEMDSYIQQHYVGNGRAFELAPAGVDKLNAALRFCRALDLSAARDLIETAANRLLELVGVFGGHRFWLWELGAQCSRFPLTITHNILQQRQLHDIRERAGFAPRNYLPLTKSDYAILPRIR